MVEPRRWRSWCSRAWVYPLMLVMLGATGAMAEDDDSARSGSWKDTPEWLRQMGVSGRYVGTVGGSEAKYLEDHNIQSGPVLTLGIEEDLEDEGVLSIEGMSEPLQDQGYLLFNLEVPERFSLHSEIQAWREFYNTRTGEEDETVNRGNFGSFLPGSNNSTHFFGGGKPKVDWLRTRSGFEVELPGSANDFRADFLYRSVRGEMSLLKGGTVLDPQDMAPTLDIDPFVPGSGPGTVLFDISGRKQIDYESIGGEAGLRAEVAGVNFQIDVRGMRHELKSTAFEANFDATAGSSELEIFGRDTTLDSGSIDLVGSRHLRHDLFVFGGASFSYERSEPDPTQVVQAGILTPTPVRVVTRETLESEITRFSESLTLGAVFMPAPSVTVRASASLRASQQEGDLTERRDESSLLTGDVGTILNDSQRDTVSARIRVKGDWRARKRLKISGFAHFDFRHEKAESTRLFNFVVIESPEIEDYTNQRSKFRLGGKARYRFRRGRTVEGGYEFTYVGFESDVDQISNQVILADYEQLRHRIHMKAVGRITKKLRGELRAQYVFETRTLDAPNVNPPDVAVGLDGEIEIQGFLITPVLTYQHDEHWGGVLSASIGRQSYELVDAGAAPVGFSSRFAGFEYEALTATLTGSMNWAPTDQLRNVLSYTLYHNSESVENLGHDASIRTSYALDENWDVNGTVRYLGFAPNDNVVDDYHTVIVSAGLTGRF